VVEVEPVGENAERERQAKVRAEYARDQYKSDLAEVMEENARLREALTKVAGYMNRTRGAGTLSERNIDQAEAVIRAALDRAPSQPEPRE
jgi:hypothetical protein